MQDKSTHETLVKQADYNEGEIREMWRLAEEHHPELWRKCYPRIYRDYKSNEYYTPKEPARQMFGCALKIDHGFIGESEKMEAMWASHMAKYRTPTYWVTGELIEALMLTKPRITLDWYNMPLPVPAACFLIPKGFLVHQQEGDAMFVSYSRNRLQEGIPALNREGPRTWGSSNGAMTFWAKTKDTFTHWNIPYDVFPSVNLTALDELIHRYEDNVHTSSWLSTPEMTREDTLIGAKVAHLIFGLLLLMTAKPEIVTKAVLERKIEKKGSPPKEFWSPNIIGEHYRIRRVGESLGGTHASPRGHWVQGYWREQRYGAKRMESKDIWIEPFWRGGEAESE